MRYALLSEDGVVVQIQPNPQEGFIEVPAYVVCGMVQQGDGSFAAPPPSPPTASEVEAAVSAALGEQARALGYDNILTAVSYVTSAAEQYRTEAVHLRDWRDMVWQAVYSYINSAETLSVQDALDAMPPLSSVAGWEAYRAMVLRRADALMATDPLQAMVLRQAVK